MSAVTTCGAGAEAVLFLLRETFKGRTPLDILFILPMTGRYLQKLIDLKVG